jgi:xanthine/CO dehydrogenase XdhC/CoxF family maturation factor
LEIGSQTVPEIAVSIVGEMIAKRNLGGRPLKQGVRHRPAAPAEVDG